MDLLRIGWRGFVRSQALIPTRMCITWKKHGMCELHTPRDYAKFPARDTFDALKNG